MNEDPPSSQVDFFVSRAGANRAVAREVADVLRNAGYAVVYQDDDIPVGSNFIEKMDEFLRRCRHLIVLYSAAYENSPFCRQEWTHFLASSARAGFARRFIVFRVEECEPKGLFSAFVYADLSRVTAPDARKSIILAAAEGRPEDTPRIPPVFFGVPARNAYFAPREDLLQQLCSTLLDADGKPGAVTQAQAIKGLGGVGKTSLAAEYAYAHASVYGGVWWAPAERRETLVASLAVLGRRLDPNLESVDDIEVLAQQALSLLARSAQPWLLVYDNVETPDSIRGLLPRSGVHVLLTTRWADWGGEARELRVDVLPLAVARTYLQTRAGRNDEEGADRLALALGCLPLALDHAAAYCRRAGVGFDEYRRSLDELIAEAPRGAAYPDSVFKTFSLSLRKAAEIAPQAETLMGIVANLAPEQIPVDLIPATVMSALDRNRAIAALSEVSLLRFDAGAASRPSLSVHRLVQLVMRRILGVKQVAAPAAISALDSIADAFGRGDASWQRRAELLPSALSAIENLRQTEGATGKERKLLVPVAAFLAKQGDRGTAQRLLRFELVYMDKEEPADWRLDGLVRALWAAGLLAEAETISAGIYARARGRVPQEDATGFAATCMLRAEVLADMGRFQEAESFGREALEWMEYELGPENQGPAMFRRALAQVLESAGKLEEAGDLLKRAYATNMRQGNQSNAVRDLIGLSRVLADLGRFESAEDEARRALALIEKSGEVDRRAALPASKGYPLESGALVAMAGVLSQRGRWTEAAAYQSRAYEILERALGAKHVETVSAGERLDVMKRKAVPDR